MGGILVSNDPLPGSAVRGEPDSVGRTTQAQSLALLGLYGPSSSAMRAARRGQIPMNFMDDRCASAPSACGPSAREPSRRARISWRGQDFLSASHHASCLSEAVEAHRLLEGCASQALLLKTA
jgi:hypothetical protein